MGDKEEGVEGYVGVSETFQTWTNETDRPMNTEEEAAAEIARSGGTIEDDEEDADEDDEEGSAEGDASVGENKTAGPLLPRP